LSKRSNLESLKAGARVSETEPHARARARRGAEAAATDPRNDSGEDIWDPDITPPQLAAKPEGKPGRPSPQTPPQPIARGRSPVRVDARSLEPRREVFDPAYDDPVPTFALPPRIEVRKRSRGGGFWFFVCVVLPTALAAYYYGWIASNQYQTEFRFTVKNATLQSSPTANVSNGLLTLLGAGGGSNDNYIVVDYLTSRQAVDALQSRINLVELYSKPEADWWSRFNPTRPTESFMRYWSYMVSAQFDQVTGIASATVRAFTPQDSYLIATTLVTLSEELVNQIANRTNSDAVKFASAEVQKAEDRLKKVRERLTEYRNRTGVIDPNTSVVASSAALVQTLRGTLAQLETQLATYRKQSLLPTAPAVVALNYQIASVREQLKKVESSVGSSADGRALSVVTGEYEQLDLERQFAQTMLISTQQALDQARANAAAQHLYITPYVRPSMPTMSTYPRRILSVLFVAGVSFALWIAALMIVRSIKERFA
jgi:capsular polysaccharide transport system permease protein